MTNPNQQPDEVAAAFELYQRHPENQLPWLRNVLGRHVMQGLFIHAYPANELRINGRTSGDQLLHDLRFEPYYPKQVVEQGKRAPWALPNARLLHVGKTRMFVGREAVEDIADMYDIKGEKSIAFDIRFDEIQTLRLGKGLPERTAGDMPKLEELSRSLVLTLESLPTIENSNATV